MRLRRAFVIAGAVVIPFIVQAALVVGHEELNDWLMSRYSGIVVGAVMAILAYAALVVNVGTGFALLMREFKASRLVVALLYWPLMWAALFLFSIGLIGRLYGI